MNIAASAENTQLVTIPEDTALSVFTTEKAMDPFMARIRHEIDAFVPDMTTATGRKAIASMAYKVSRTKTYLDAIGKALNDQQKEIPKKIDACRKVVRDTLDGWADEVRKPLTDWEAAEDARVKKHTDAMTSMNELARLSVGLNSTALRENLAMIDAVIIGPGCDEFEAEYARAKDAARTGIAEEIPRAEKREAEAAELIRLRNESEKRRQSDHEQKIRDEAALEATKAAEAAAQRKLDDESAKTTQALADAEAAKKRAADTEARLKKEAADKANADVAELERREANKRHCSAINRKAVAAFVEGGMTEKAAMQAVTLIAKKVIPAITITY